MEEVININEKFSEELFPLCGKVDSITVYRKEDDKVFFRVGDMKFHITKKEYSQIKKQD